MLTMVSGFRATPENVTAVVNAWLPRYYREHPDPTKALLKRRVRAPGGNCVTKAAVACVLFEIDGVESHFSYDQQPDVQAYKTLNVLKKPFCEPLRHAWTGLPIDQDDIYELRLEVADTPEFQVRTRKIRHDAVRLPVREGLRAYFEVQYGRPAPAVGYLQELVSGRLEREIKNGVLVLPDEA